MKTKKFISLLCGIAMVVTIVTACGETKSGNEGTSANAESSQATGSDPAKLQEIVQSNISKLGFEVDPTIYKQAKFPLVEQPVTLTFACIKQPTNLNFADMSFFKKYEALTNVSIKWTELPAATAMETKNLMLASGEKLPDAFYMGQNNTITDYDIVTYGTQGVFVPLNDYIQNDMPNLMAVFEKRPNYKKLCTLFDGNIYAFPYIEEMGIIHVASIHYMNKAWLDRLNLPVPATTAQFEDTLKAFSTQDANGNGDANDEVPFSFIFGDPGFGINYLFGAFGRNDNTQHIVVEDGKVVFTADKEEYRQAVKWFNKLYSEKLIDSEAFTQDFQQFASKSKLDIGKTGSFMAWRDFQVLGNDIAKSYIPLKPLIGPDGKQMWGRENKNEMNKNAFVITKDAKDKDLIARWVDGLYDEEMSIESNWGTFNIVQKKNDQGLWAASLGLVPKGMTMGEFVDSNRAKGPSACLDDIYGRLCAMEEGGAGRLQILKDNYNQYLPKEFYPPITFEVKDNQEINKLQTEIVRLVDEMTAKWIIKGGIDEEWDGYVQNLNKIGVNEWISLLQKGYDGYSSTK